MFAADDEGGADDTGVGASSSNPGGGAQRERLGLGAPVFFSSPSALAKLGAGSVSLAGCENPGGAQRERLGRGLSVTCLAYLHMVC